VARTRFRGPALLTTLLVSLGGLTVATAPADAAGPGVVRSDGPHLHAWWYDAMRIPAAHRVTEGAGARVAVIDNGFHASDPGLRGADVHLMGNCFGNEDPDEPLGDASAHGTEMALLLAGNGRAAGGRPGFLGIAPRARIDLWNASPVPYCDDKQEQAMALAAARSGADIISISLQLTGDWTATLEKISSYGTVVVAAAGNRPDGDTAIISPAKFRGVVAVNAIDRNADAWKGNTTVSQPMLDHGSGYPAMSAPGVDIPSYGWSKQTGWTKGRATGTSNSTAIVAGALALVKSQYPSATGNQLIQHLIHYSGGTGPFRWDPYYGFGVASVTKMLAHDPTQWPDENPLLLTPEQVVATYPMSVRHPASTASNAPAADPGTDSGSTTARSTSSGVPVVVWVALVVLVLAGAAAAVTLTRRRRVTAVEPARAAVQQSDTEKQGV